MTPYDINTTCGRQTARSHGIRQNPLRLGVVKTTPVLRAFRALSAGTGRAFMIGFIYLWYDRKCKMFYLGGHLGQEDDGYIGGGRRFIEAYRKRPEDFKRRIILRISEGTLADIRKAEGWYLNLIKRKELRTRYYNSVRAAIGFNQEANLRIHSQRDEAGKSLHALKAGHARGVVVHSNKNADGKSIHAVKNAAITHNIKDGNGKSVHAIRMGHAGAGKPKSIEHKRKIKESHEHCWTPERRLIQRRNAIGRICITNGELERRISSTEDIPEGWRIGVKPGSRGPKL